MEVRTIQSFVDERPDYEPVIQRLRRMRERMKPAEVEQSALSLLEKFNRKRSHARVDWLKSKLRWFANPDDAARVNANIEVEVTLGRTDPELWDLGLAHAKHSGAFTKPVGIDLDYEKQSRELAKFTQSRRWEVDPMVAADREYLDSLAGGRDSDDRRLYDDVVNGGDHGKNNGRHLRLLEIHRGEQDIVDAAVDVVNEIKMICSDDQAEHQQDSGLTGVSILEESADADADFTPPADLGVTVGA